MCIRRSIQPADDTCRRYTPASCAVPTAAFMMVEPLPEDSPLPTTLPTVILRVARQHHVEELTMIITICAVCWKLGPAWTSNTLFSSHGLFLWRGLRRVLKVGKRHFRAHELLRRRPRGRDLDSLIYFSSF
jgi:hypothetical protein